MNVGVCYFPEHWDESTREPAVERMAAAGIEYVRMGEFAWGRLEPERGEFAFDWLDEVLDHLAAHDLQAVLCTPTAAPPKWLYDERPSIRRVRPEGTTEGFGSRRAYCVNSAAYQEETDRIVSTLAERYADRDVVAGWQTDNEYGCHETTRCYCEECADAFRSFLRERYDSIADLNEAWGTAFWSQQYDSFAAVDPPQPTPSAHHPALLLAYYRFASHSVVEYNRRQVEMLREANDEWFVTHNTMGEFGDIDLHDLGGTVDFVAWDSYPTGFVQTHRDRPATPDELRAGDPDDLALNHAICRGTSADPFWIMEQQPGDINWPPHGTQPGEGAMALWALQAVGHGAETVSYFRWRACSQGQEQYHSGLLDHAGDPDRGYRDAADAAADLATLADHATAGEDTPDGHDPLPQPAADVAVLLDYESLWALHEQPHAPDFDYWRHLRTYFDALRARGVTVDVAHPDDDLGDYAAVVAPTLYLVDEERATNLEEFVRGGGHLLATIRTGFKDRHNRVHETPRPGPLSELVGAAVDQHESVPDTLDTVVSYEGNAYDYRTWAEWLTPESATALGEHVAGVGAGEAAITRNETGNGEATYVGIWSKSPLADALCGDWLTRAGVAHRDEVLPDGVRLVQRGDHYFLSNFTSETVGLGTDDEDVVVGSTPVGAYDYLVGRGDATEVEVAVE